MDCFWAFWLAFCAGVLGSGTVASQRGEPMCGAPGVVVGGRIEPNKSEFYEGEVVRYFCEPKYQLLGKESRNCTGGLWSGPMPVCAYQVKLVNATQSSNYSKDTMASMAIDGNYSSCSSLAWGTGGYWHAIFNTGNTSISAIRITFPPGKNVKIGVRVIVQPGSLVISCGKTDMFNTGTDTSIVFFCPRNTVGRQISITNLFPQKQYFSACEVEVFTSTNITCRLPDTPLNSHKNFVSNSYRSTYMFRCKEGYELEGHNETHCMNNGTWFPAAPICKAITCSPPQSIKNGMIRYDRTADRLYYNDTATYTCYKGFTLTGNSVLRCVAQNQWSENTPQCLSLQTSPSKLPKVPCQPYMPDILNGYVKTEGMMATLSCNSGFEPVKDVSSQCHNGTWQTVIFRCKEIKCYAPAAVSNGQVIRNKEHEKYQIKCNEGFVLNPRIMVYCQSNGKWLNTEEACIEITCGLPPEIVDGLWKPSNVTVYKAGTNLTLQCDYVGQHKMEPPLTINCQSNGNWTKLNNTCSALKSSMVEGNESSSNIAILGAFLIGAATSIAIIGTIAGILTCRRRRNITKVRSSQSIFHIAHPYLNTHLASPANNITQSSEDEDEHIYQVALYEPVPQTSEAGSTLPIRSPKHLPLQPCYSQPFENKRTLADDFHIYAEPVDLGDSIDSSLNIRSESCHIYSESPGDNVYSYISDERCVSQPDSFYLSSTTTTTTTDTLPIGDILTHQMKDNDLYISESEDEVFE